MQPSITLKHISNLSGFSISTVSKALNDHYEISFKTKKLIKSIAKENNYTPNNQAVALRIKRTFNIAIILPKINDEFYSCLLSHIEKVAYNFGYRIILFQSFEIESKIKESISKVNNGSVDGIIVISENNIAKIDTYLPITEVKIEKNETVKLAKKECVSSFTKLIKSVNKKDI